MLKDVDAMAYYSNCLMHHGIKGQQWGVRRFQNEDGTLTEEGKARYYNSLTDNQKKLYNKFSRKDQDRIERKLAEGKSFTRAAQETAQRRKNINDVKVAVVGTAAYLGMLAYVNPNFRNQMKAALFTTASKVASNGFVQRNAQKIRKMVNRHAMKKAGAIVLKSKDYNIFSGLLG